VRVRDKQALIKHPSLLEAVAQAETRLEGRGRVNVRPSGTEPLVRVMVEGPEEMVEPVCDELVALVERLDRTGEGEMGGEGEKKQSQER
jgi:phosphoglucosamine mutase